jgi:hypothetical protein
MSNQNLIWNDLLAGTTPWGDLTVSTPLFNMSFCDLVISPIPSWGDLVLIDPPEEPEELDEEEMPGDELNNAFWEEFHPAELLEDPLAEENDLIVPAPILEALRGEAADVSPPSHREENP